MDRQIQQGAEDLEEVREEASGLLSVPEGAREYVDLIGDENLDSFGKPASDFQQQ